tara:strand:- start:257 stop:1855 length:1599 start_codon:yes stop_codon:yes gene_type:complete
MDFTEAGQFEIEKAVLFTSTGNEINIRQSTIEIVIYEDINSNSMYGEIQIANTIGLISHGPLIGQEYLQLVLTTPTLQDSKHKIYFEDNVFHVIKVARGYEAGGEIVTLDFTTSEIIHNQRTLVSRHLKGTYHEMVESLLRNDLNCKKDLYIEQTNDVKSIITNNRRPFDIISQLTTSSTSSEHGTPAFVFFENFKGYHFRSLQSLYAEGSRFKYVEVEANSTVGSPSNPGMSGPKLNAKITRDLQTIVNSTIVGAKDLSAAISVGALSSRLITHDIIQKKINVSNYNYLDDDTVLDQSIEGYATGGEVKDFHQYTQSEIDENGNRISDFIPIQYLAPTSTIKNKDGVYKNSQYEIYNGEKKETEYVYDPRKHETTLQKRRSLFTNMDLGVKIDLVARGQTTYGAGDLVSLNVNDFSKLDTADSDKRDKFLRGDWLVESVKHVFNSVSERHTMYVSLMKDVVDEEFDPADHVERKPVLDGRLFSNEHFYGNLEGYDETVGPNAAAAKQSGISTDSFKKRSLTLGKLQKLQRF